MIKLASTTLLAVILPVIVACALLGATEARAAKCITSGCVGDGPNVVFGTGDGLSVLQSPSPKQATLAQADPQKIIFFTRKWIAVFFLIACAVVGLAWWLGRLTAKDRINALKERIKFARKQCSDIELSDLKDQVAVQKELISELVSNSDPERERVKELARGNTQIQNALINLATSTSHLSNKLIIVRLFWPRNKGRFVLGNTLIILRPVRPRKRSSYRYGSQFRL
jgi:hypothetical protein